MTQNLALGSTEGTMTLTSADSNVSSNFVLPQAQATSDVSTPWGDYANTSNTPHLYATGNDSYGNYYNWYAATAGTGLGTMQSASAISLTNATNDICPKGWRLPDGGQSENESYYKLDTSLDYSGANRTDGVGLSSYVTSPYLFPFSAHYSYSSGVRPPGLDGHEWTRSASTNAGQAYAFYIHTGGYVYPQYSSDVGRGFSIRCVASNQDFWSISTMQEMTPEIVSSVVTPSTTAASAVTNATDYANTYDKTSVVPERILTDARDGETYRVRKLADGNVWMTENLRLTLTEGQAIEISDGSMWLPKNYDGTTTNSTTLTVADQDSRKWYTADPSQPGTDIVRSYNTAGSEGIYKCYSSWGPSSGSGLRPFGTQECHETAQTYDGETQRYGVYYNWYTATAGEGMRATTTQTSLSVCPKNWGLPSVTSFNRLFFTVYGYGNSQAGSEAIRSFPFSYILSGLYQTDFGSATLASGTTVGTFHSSMPSVDSDGNAVNYHLLQLSSTGYNASSSQRKRNGAAIRCAISGL